MRFLTNEDVAGLLEPATVVDALRSGYSEYRAGGAAQLPRADLLAPASSGFHRLGVMAGVSRATDVAVVRIKSDVVTWRSDREHKQAGEPGRYSGTIIAFRVSDGMPLAIVQDGVLQHLRVAAAAALGTDLLAPTGVTHMAVLGSGGMARAIVSALSVLRTTPDTVSVYSPTPQNRSEFAAVLTDELNTHVTACEQPDEAVAGAGLVISATNSLEPTINPEWLAPDVHVTAVSRREIGPRLRSRAQFVACLGPSSYPADAVPGMESTRGGYAAFIAATESERSGIPRTRISDLPGEYSLMTEDPPWTNRPCPLVSVLTAVGTQGVQFAATVGALLRLATELEVGTEVPDTLFLHEVRT